MGAVSGLIGTAGGAGGTGFEAPGFGGNAPIDPFGNDSPAAVKNAGKDTNTALGSQQDLLAALQAQNGIGNQSQVYNQMQGVVNGTGPNPAQAMLNQATGANVANQAALMAGQRGAGANVGLMARLAAQQGANTQQQAVGQGATMQAQQSLNALNNAGNIAGNQTANQINATGANTTARQNQQQMLLNSLAGYNSTNAGLQANINSANASLANTTMQGQQSIIGGLGNAFGAGSQMGGAAALAGAEGGLSDTLPVVSNPSALQPANGPQSSIGKAVNGMPFDGFSDMGGNNPGAQELRKGSQAAATGLMNYFNSPAKPQAVAGAGDQMQGGAPIQDDIGGDPEVMKAASGGVAHDMRDGGHVKAKSHDQKAEVAGNSYANDKIPAVLSEGEVVIPRDVMSSADPASAAAKFVQGVLAKRMAKGGEVKLEPHQEGVHRQSGVSGNGQSIAGNMVREGDMKGAKASHEHKLEQLRQMPKPKLYAEGDVVEAPQAYEQPAPADPDNYQTTDFHTPQNVVDSINAPSPMQARDQYVQQAQANAAADPKNAYLQNEVGENNKYTNDLYNGHITPKTYADLFADKGTLGKIGTIFGLMVGGAGSGLAHQQNALLGMMDKQIQNDINAQIKSKDNAQNFWKINQADLANKVSAMGGLENAKTAAYARTQLQTYQAGLHHLIDIAKKAPPSQQRAYQNAITNLSKQINEKASNIMDQASTQMAVNGIPFNRQPGAPAPQQMQAHGAQNKQAPKTVSSQASGSGEAPVMGAGIGAIKYDDDNLRPGSDKAPEAPEAPQIKVDVNGFKRSQQLGADGVPKQMQPGEVGAANDEMDSYNRANQLLKEVHKQFPEMWKHGKHADLLATGLEGAHILGMQIPNPGSAFPGMKEYNTASSAIKKQLGNLLKGGLSPETSELIQKQFPHANDTPAQYREKLETIDRLIMTQVPKSVLKKYNLVKGLPD